MQNDKITANCEITETVSESELTDIVNSLPNGKSASYDNITYEHIKYGGPVLIYCLTKLFNSILTHESTNQP